MCYVLNQWYDISCVILYNVRLRRVRVTIVAVRSNKYYIFSVCVCSLSYPARKAHAPYYIAIGGLSSCTIFFTLSHIRQKERKILNIK